MCGWEVCRAQTAEGLFPLPAAFSFRVKGAFSDAMHLLYLDDSGSVKNAADKHIILAGLSVFERVPYWLSKSLDVIAGRVWPEDPNAIEFRGADIFSGKKHWRGVGKDDRLKAYEDALRVLANSTRVTLFGAVIHKAAVSPEDPMEFAFEQTANRFDRMLGRLHRANRDPDKQQRGLIILDESTYETSLQSLATEFRAVGHRWGNLRYLAEVPLFVNSKATRMIQYADLVAYALRRYHENGDSKYIDIIRGRFDSEGGIVHGHTHRTPTGQNCNCFSCRQRTFHA